MATNNREKLFAEFPPVSTEAWEAAITADLKGADYERKLVWRTNEGFNLRPYYRAENLEGLETLAAQAGEFPYLRGVSTDNTWLTHQTIKVVCPKEANATALAMLESGVDSLGFCFCEAEVEPTAESIEVLLAGIVLPAVDVTVCGKYAAKAGELILAHAEKAGVAKAELRLNIALDPLVKGMTVKGACCDCEALVSLVKATQEYKKVRVITVMGHHFSDAGSTIVEELAFSLAAAHDYLVWLMEEGCTIDEVARKIRFSFAVTSNYFMEMAKFRAARLLWANIVKKYEPACDCSCKLYAHARTSAWNQTAYDPYVNMLRGTTEAMSAAIAGVHSLEVLPFDHSYAEPSEFSYRIARNESLLLKHESHFDQVIDPAGGSYYIENLTNSIATEAWKLFLNLEEEFPSLRSDAVGQVLDVVRTTCRVDYLVEVRLVLEEQRLVTSDAVRELRWLSVRVVERKNLQRVNTCDSSRHSLGSTTQHIYIRVISSLVPSRCTSVCIHLARAVANWLVLSYDISPQHTCSAELCHLHKVVRSNSEREANLTSNLVDGATLLHQPYEVVVSSSQ